MSLRCRLDRWRGELLDEETEHASDLIFDAGKELDRLHGVNDRQIERIDELERNDKSLRLRSAGALSTAFQLLGVMERKQPNSYSDRALSNIRSYLVELRSHDNPSRTTEAQIFDYKLRPSAELFGKHGPCVRMGWNERNVMVRHEFGAHLFKENDTFEDLPSAVMGLGWTAFADTMRVHVDIAKALYVQTVTT